MILIFLLIFSQIPEVRMSLPSYPTHLSLEIKSLTALAAIKTAVSNEPDDIILVKGNGVLPGAEAFTSPLSHQTTTKYYTFKQVLIRKFN